MVGRALRLVPLAWVATWAACSVPALAPNASSHLCSGEGCVGSCEVGFADCNGSLDADGCETSVATAAACGACGVACETGQLCTAHGCAWASCGEALPGRTGCGPRGDEDCCASLDVPGGTFQRRNDAASASPGGFVATVHAFRLDRFEVTVGRFRAFLGAVAAGWRPVVGAGKHAYLARGGLLVEDGGFRHLETGWTGEFAGRLSWSRALWDDALACGGDARATWTPAPGANEDRPIVCTDWSSAVLFCAWDGGFVPSEAEWHFAAGGGAEQRVRPWSAPPEASAIDDAHAVYCDVAGCARGAEPVGSRSPLGDGRWGHADLVGNADEWLYDGVWDLADWPMPCTDCAREPDANGWRATAGSGFARDADAQRSFDRGMDDYALRPGRDVLPYVELGIRCARAPR